MKGVHASKEIFGILQDSFRFFFVFFLSVGTPKQSTHTYRIYIYIYMLYIYAYSVGVLAETHYTFSWVGFARVSGV